MASKPKVNMFQQVIRALFRMVKFPCRPFLAVVHWCAVDYKKLTPSVKNDTWIVAAVLIAAAAVGAFFTFDAFTYSYWKARGSDNAAEIVRNLGLLAAAIVGLVFAIWRTMIAQKGSYLTEQGQITDRYATAVKLLAADTAQTRIGAIYALKRIAQDSPERDFLPVVDLLSEFVRDPPYRKEQALRAAKRVSADRDPETDVPPPIKCPDINVAIIVLNEIVGGGGARLAEVGPASLLRAVDLNRARLNDLALIYAMFDSALLDNANLSGADLSDARLRGAVLIGTDLSDAYLGNANLTRAHLSNVNLRHADLSDAVLSDAGLTDAIDLTQEQIDSARPWPPPASLPDGIVWPFEDRDGEWVYRKKE